MSAMNPLRMALGPLHLKALLAFMGLLVVLWVTFLPLNYALVEQWQHAPPGGEVFFLVLVGVISAWLGHVLGLSLGTGARVLGQHLVPMPLWRRWVLSSLKQTLVLWAVLAGCAVTVLLPTQAPWHGLTGAAVVSMAVGLSALRTLAVQGLAPGFWAWAGPLGLLYALVGSEGARGVTHALRSADALPWAALLAAALSWPALSLVLSARWFRQVPQAKAQGPVSATAMWQHARRFVLRYTPLTAWVDEVYPASAGYRRFVVMRTLWALYVFLNPAFLGQPWGSAVPVWQLWVLGLVSFVVSANLVCKDLHWRMLLAPARVKGRALGWHIVFSTATVYGVVLIVSGSLIVAAVLLFLPIGFSRVTEYLARFYLAPVQLVFAIAVGTLIRGASGTKRWQLGLIALWFFGGGALWFFGFFVGFGFIEAKCFTVGFPYLVGLVLVSAWAIWLANRLWTVEKLLHSAPR